MRRLVFALLLAACRSPVSPSSRVPELGRYAYASPLAGDGTLTITDASADRLSASWDVRGPFGTMTGPVVGEYRDGAYRLVGLVSRVTPAGPAVRVLEHRVTRDGDRLTCVVGDQGATVAPVACSLTRLP